MSHEFQAAYLGSRRERLIYKEQIGIGSYAVVKRAEWKDINGRVTMVAAKRLHQEFLMPEHGQEAINHCINEFRKEWETLRNLDHPNIVKLFKFMSEPPTILMELMHCDLRSYINKSTSTPKVSPEKVVSIALGVAKGLEYLHGQNPSIVHRDLASKNILLTEDGHPKIADLGLAKAFPFGQDAAATPGTGTPLYAAPETLVARERAMYGPSVDIFSFGVVLMEMCIGHDPRITPMKGKLLEINRRQSDIDEMEEGKLKKLVLKCLQDKSSKRPSARKLVSKLDKIKLKTCGSHVSHEFTVLFLGNHNVGKSTLIEMLRNPHYDVDKDLKMKATVAIESLEHSFHHDGKLVKMSIIDTSGEEQYFCLTSSYYRNVDGVFLVFDVCEKVSFRSLTYWIGNLRKYNSKDDLQMLLVGNKADLRETTDADDLVPPGRAIEFASNINSPYVETSVKDAASVEQMYQKMVRILMSTVSPEDVSDQVGESAEPTIRLQSQARQNNPRELRRRSTIKFRNKCWA